TAAYAWSGRYLVAGNVVHMTNATPQDSSYGYNRFLTANGGFAPASARIPAKNLSDVPVFLDATFADFRPLNGKPTAPAPSPPNLRGDKIGLGAPEHWRFLIARHGRGVNAFLADGSARW